MEGGRLRLIEVEYELLAAVEEDVKDEMEVVCAVRRARRSSFWVSGLEASCRGGRSVVGTGPSGIAEREDTVMLGLGGSKEEVEEEGEPDIELTDERLLFM
jgi:hypothetical protein